MNALPTRPARFPLLTAFAFALFVFHPAALRALDDGLALTPPMGWNSWNRFGCNVDEGMVRSMADAMATNGMKNAGYQYIVIDDCWQVARDSDGNILADPQRFHSGIKALADYVHGKGLKFGLYSCAGTNTCAGRPGGRGYESQDARQYATWGVDYLKYDWCNHGPEGAQAAYSTMSRALKEAGRPVVFSLCEWGSNKPWLWARDVGHLWRTTGDIADCWDCTNQWSYGWVRILDWQNGLEAYAGPGHWNDPDMLEVGNGHMSPIEYRSHFSLWCILAAPLMAGNDLRTMRPEIRAILTNRELIAVDQDPLGIQGRRLQKQGDSEVWSRPLQDGSRAVVLFNRGNVETRISISFDQLGFLGSPHSRVESPKGAEFAGRSGSAARSAHVRDLWREKNLGRFEGKFSAPVPPHGVVVVKVRG